MKRRIRICTVFVAIAVWLFVLAATAFSYVSPSRAEGLSYAQIHAGGATLYVKKQNEFVPVTTLPATYFVCLTGEMTEGYLPVGYLDMDGYVYALDVTVVDYEPVYKYAADAKLTLVSDGHTVNLRSTPDHTADNIVFHLPQTAVLHYYGSLAGSTQVEPLGNTWYYVRYETGGNVYRGYVYTLYAAPAAIPNNIIERVPVLPPDGAGNASEPKEDPFRPGSVISVIVIVSMCIPAAAVLIFLYRSESGKKKRPLNAD